MKPYSTFAMKGIGEALSPIEHHGRVVDPYPYRRSSYTWKFAPVAAQIAKCLGLA